MERTRGTKTGPTNPTSGAPGPAARLDIFGPPPLIEGEDAAAYDELLVRISAAVKPADILEDIWFARSSISSGAPSACGASRPVPLTGSTTFSPRLAGLRTELWSGRCP
jgi:hypothetical protein